MKKNFKSLLILMLTLTSCEKINEIRKSQPALQKLENEIVKDVEEVANEEIQKDLDKRNQKK